MSIPTRVLLVVPLTFAFAGYFLRLPVKDKVAALKGVEFRRPRIWPSLSWNFRLYEPEAGRPRVPHLAPY